jgi:ParB family transcriptional regulator, chromosome partitioning protein
MGKKTIIKEKETNIDIKHVINLDSQSIIPPNIAMRENISNKSIESLAKSIEEIGLIYPLTVMPQGTQFEIVAGARRYMAMMLLKWKFMPSFVLESNSEMYFRTMAAENYERQDISIFDEVTFIQKLQYELKLTQAQIAKYIGKSVSYVNERIAVIDYPECLKIALVQEEITFSVAREFNKITESVVQEQYLHYAIENGCTPAVARKWRQQWENQQAHPQMTDLSDMEDNYNDAVQKVTVNQECASCHGTFEAQELMPLYVCKPCRTAILT